MDPTSMLVVAAGGYFGARVLRKIGNRPGVSRLILGVTPSMQKATAPLRNATALVRHRPGRRPLRRTR